MGHVSERVPVKLPYRSARARLRRYVETVIAGKQPLQVTLTLDGKTLAIVRKDVMLTYGRAVDPTRFDELWSVRWTPHEGGPFPDFDGVIGVTHAGEAGGAAYLELRGSYDAPFGIAGAAFDVVAGSAIAARTARVLLGRIAAELEALPETESPG